MSSEDVHTSLQCNPDKNNQTYWTHHWKTMINIRSSVLIFNKSCIMWECNVPYSLLNLIASCFVPSAVKFDYSRTILNKDCLQLRNTAFLTVLAVDNRQWHWQPTMKKKNQSSRPNSSSSELKCKSNVVSLIVQSSCLSIWSFWVPRGARFLLLLLFWASERPFRAAR